MIKKTQLVTAIGAVAGASFATAAIAADQTANPFQADDLNAGSLSQNFNIGDDKEGSCGEGSCGEDKDKGDDSEGSCGEGSCGEGHDEGEGDDHEGSCGEGSCGEGSCGEA